MDKIKLTMNIRRMNKLIAEGNKATATADKERNTIAEDKDHSDSWKQKRLQEIHKTEQATIRKVGKAINELSPYFTTVCDEAATAFDFTDPVFQNALGMVKSFGKTLPVMVRNSITERFRGNPTALELLQKAFEAKDMSTEAFKPMRELFNTPRRAEETLGEVVGYSTSDVASAVQWKPHSLSSLMRDFEKTFGVDSSVNPYLAELQKMQTDKGLNSNQRRRLESFLAAHGEDLQNDDVETMELAARSLETKFILPIDSK